MRPRREPAARAVVATGLLLLLGGCAGTHNYTEPGGPRFGSAIEGLSPVTDSLTDDGELTIVSFNIRFSVKVDPAIGLLREDPELRRADIIFLQEMDVPGARRIAQALGMHWVYYPATRHPKYQRDFGNAILARWPLEDDTKLILPHRARLGGTQRIAVGATVHIGGAAYRIYSLHLATFVGNGPKARREQLARVLEDAESHARVILVGDFNSSSVPEIALPRGYSWPTRDLPPTAAGRTIDHILLKGIEAPAPIRSGVVEDNRETSDHRPIWLVIPGGPG